VLLLVILLLLVVVLVVVIVRRGPFFRLIRGKLLSLAFSIHPSSMPPSVHSQPRTKDDDGQEEEDED
jgi:hypothetical protein